jgi:hypothetical protein
MGKKFVHICVILSADPPEELKQMRKLFTILVNVHLVHEDGYIATDMWK